MLSILLFVLFLTAASLATVFIILFLGKIKEFNETFERYKDVIDIEKEIVKVSKKQDERQKQYDKFASECLKQENSLKECYALKKATYDMLFQEVSILEERQEELSYGFYEPYFDYDTPERYKIELQNIRKQQKEMVRLKSAANCSKEWVIEGSKSEGNKMVNRTIKLMMRAFNNECDAAVLKVRWNNVQLMRERITKAYEAINKLGDPVAIQINPSYLELKLKEVSLAHEHKEKLEAQKEEQRKIREQMREEEKVRREIEKTMQEAAKQEYMYHKALDAAKKELLGLEGDNLAIMMQKISILEKQLAEAEEKTKRAQSMAEKTRSGHVYIISNIGSFGKHVYKIGLTRRLEPTDRVKELGDASVPFPFDIHAMIYSEDAPSLETEFHRQFSNQQVNLANPRKEFFAVSLNEIEKFALDKGFNIEFTKTVEAKELRETLAIKKRRQEIINQQIQINSQLPASL